MFFYDGYLEVNRTKLTASQTVIQAIANSLAYLRDGARVSSTEDNKSVGYAAVWAGSNSTVIASAYNVNAASSSSWAYYNYKGYIYDNSYTSSMGKATGTITKDY